jgi:hypothetical protein
MWLPPVGNLSKIPGIVEKIKAAYRCIGEPDPFKPKDVQSK